MVASNGDVATANGNPENSNAGNVVVAEVEDDRGNWSNQCEFFLSCLGYAVGFGNVWRFPYLCYKNGGAAFLIPYVIMLLIAGLPIFFLELAIGQYVSLGPNILFPKLSPLMGGVGWGMIVTTGLVSMFYNMVFAKSIFYTFASFTSELPWGHCNHTYSSQNCYTYDDLKLCNSTSTFYFDGNCMDLSEFCGINGYQPAGEDSCMLNNSEIIKAESAIYRVSAAEDYYRSRVLGINGKSWDDMGSLRWEMVGCLAAAWIVIGLSLVKGVKSSGKVVYFTAIFPFVVLIILFFRGITLEGAMKGIEFYILKPDWARLADVQIWNDAASQIFFSLSTAFGGLITLASYNGFRVNCMRDAIVISFSNCMTSVFAGFVIFSILGFMANEAGVEVTEVVTSGSALAFIAYPAAVTMLPYPPIWSILFFIMFITLGLDSQFAFVETLTTAIFDAFPATRKRKPLVVFLLSFGMFLCGLVFCLEGGDYFFELFNWFSGWLSVIVFAILEVLTVSYLYGFKRFIKNITDDMGIKMPSVLYYYFVSCWLVLTPLVLTAVLFLSVYFYTPAYYGDYVYPPEIQFLGWCLVLVALACLPAAPLYEYFGNNKKTWKELRGPTDDFKPAHILRLMGQSSPVANEPTVKYTYDNDAFSDGNVTMGVGSADQKGYGTSGAP